MHACTSLEADLADMTTSSIETGKTSIHKENGASRIENDNADRSLIREKMNTCIDPMQTDSHPEGLVNIATGQLAKSQVNVFDAVSIGATQLKDFVDGLPNGFYNTIPRKVTTMKVMKENVATGTVKGYTSLIYQRVIGLLASGRDVNIQEVFQHELAPLPTSMFTDSGDMRIPSSKSTLKKHLQVEVPVASDEAVSCCGAVFVDGAALLWVVKWPDAGTIKDYINNVKKDIAKRLRESDVYLVFDRYYEYSAKSVTRGARVMGASREHRLHIHSKLPTQKVALTVSRNKQQIIDLITDDLIADVHFHEAAVDHRLVVTGTDLDPVQIWKKQITKRVDLSSKYEEADNTIIRQFLVLTRIDSKINVRIVADDTDIFVLLLHYIDKHKIKNAVTMRSPIRERTAVLDMNATAKAHAEIAGSLIAVHAITGCDTVASYHGIGKITAIKTMKSGISPRTLGDNSVPFESAYEEATEFISACYGHPGSVSMSDTRFRVWGERTGRGSTTHPNLCCLPPTNEGFAENVKRARYQGIIWSTLDEDEPPQMDPEQFGWKKDIETKTLIPVRLPDHARQAPDSISKLLKCGCKSQKPCSTRSCSCHSAFSSCTMFCACFGNGCCNVQK